jgi:hypothetical protein
LVVKSLICSLIWVRVRVREGYGRVNLPISAIMCRGVRRR